MTIAPPDHPGVGYRPARDGRWLIDGAVGCYDRGGRAVEGRAELVVRDGFIERLAPVAADEQNRGSSGLILVPLFVNAHDHGRGTGNVAAGIPDGPLEEWIESLRRHRGSSQEALVGDGCDLMLASGVGASVLCVNPQTTDTRSEVVAAAGAALDRGVRAAIVYPIADAMGSLYGRGRDDSGWDAGEVARRLDEVEQIAAKLDDPRLEVQLGPVGPQWVSEPTLRAVGQHAARTGRRVHMHLLESPAQRAWADTTYPEGIVRFLARAGLTGPRVCFAHGTQLRVDEIGALAEGGGTLAVNVSSNLRLCSGIPPLAAAREVGLPLGAGLDGLALGDDGDYWAELRLLRGLEQAQTGRTVDASALIERVVDGGCRAVGGCAPARPAEGAYADFQLIDIAGYEHLLSAGWTAADVALAIGRPARVAEVWVGGYRAYRHPPGPAAPSPRRGPG